ncbi:hypothetical protein NLG07_07810 [Alteromonas sp. LMIT006]|uniref:hypothetical protein n=1 Tax=Alteromonadaceae TaxID=72275 RepID=UPI0020CA58F4|nr:hypothetical protein [Alteromonas sp. LMIT006]UTP71915.1 hypothetical protein NLG07_07810 [Alteromonas sp. LMIT006]
MKYLNILFIINSDSGPENKNGITKILHNIKPRKYINVDLLSPYNSNAPSYIKKTYNCKINKSKRKSSKISSLLNGWCAEDYQKKNINSDIFQCLKNIWFDYDRIFFIGSSTISIYDDIIKFGFLPILSKSIFFAIDNKSVYFKRAIKNNTFPKNIYYWLQYRFFKKRSEVKYKFFDKVLFVSDYDSLIYKIDNPVSEKKVFTCTNGVIIPNEFENYKKNNDIYLHGNFSYVPNIEAYKNNMSIIKFIRKIDCDAKFIIFGINSHYFEKTIELTVHGVVENIYSFLPSYNNYVCYQVTGAGVKNKILEAFSKKMLVFANKEVVNGLNVEPGFHYVDISNLMFSDIANRILSITSEERIFISNNAYELVKHQYSWDSFSKKLFEL